VPYAAFVNLLSVVIGFVAAIFFCVGSALLTRKAIGDLAGTYWGSNPHFAAFLRATKAEYFCGGIALCTTFALQFLANVPGLLPERAVFSSAAVGVFVSLVVGALAGCLLLLLRRRIRAQLAVAPNAQPGP
jgi:hypothetical protein